MDLFFFTHVSTHGLLSPRIDLASVLPYDDFTNTLQADGTLVRRGWVTIEHPGQHSTAT